MDDSTQEKIQVNVEIKGELAERFMRFKAQEDMPTKSSAGLKLIKMALNMVEQQSSPSGADPARV